MTRIQSISQISVSIFCTNISLQCKQFVLEEVAHLRKSIDVEIEAFDLVVVEIFKIKNTTKRGCHHSFLRQDRILPLV